MQRDTSDSLPDPISVFALYLNTSYRINRQGGAVLISDIHGAPGQLCLHALEVDGMMSPRGRCIKFEQLESLRQTLGSVRIDQFYH